MDILFVEIPSRVKWQKRVQEVSTVVEAELQGKLKVTQKRIRKNLINPKIPWFIF